MVSESPTLVDVQTAREEGVTSGKYRFDGGDVLYSKIRPYLKKVVRPDFDGLCSADVYPLKAEADRLDPDYLFYLLLSPAFTDYAVDVSNRAGMPKVNRKQLFGYEFELPPLEEQRRVVGRIRACLDRVDAVRQLRAESAEAAGAVLPSMLAAEFDGLGDDVVEVEIGDVLEETRYGTSKKCHVEPAGTPILRIPNVSGGEVNLDDLKYTTLSEKERAKVLLQTGDILLIRSNGSPDLVGRTAVIDFDEAYDYGYASYLIRLRPDTDKVDSHYLHHFLESSGGRQAIAGIRRSSAGQHNVNSTNVAAITLPLPSLGRQRRLADRMHQLREAARKLVAYQQEQAEQEAALTQSVLARAFAGDL